MPIPAFFPMAGTQVAATFEFFDETGEPAEPTTVTFITRAPDGTATNVAGTPMGTGIYRVEWTLTMGGTWVVQAQGTGAVPVVDEAQFDVRSPVINVDS